MAFSQALVSPSLRASAPGPMCSQHPLSSSNCQANLKQCPELSPLLLDFFHSVLYWGMTRGPESGWKWAISSVPEGMARSRGRNVGLCSDPCRALGAVLWGVGGEGLRFPHVNQGALVVTDMHGNSRAARRIPGCGWHLPKALVPSAWATRASRGSGTGLPPELRAPPCPHHQPTFCKLHWSGDPAWCTSPRGGTCMAAGKEGHWMITCQWIKFICDGSADN